MAVGCGVVDRQRLYELHASSHGPVHQSLQVAEVAHAKAVLATQREYGNHHAGSPPQLLAQAQVAAVQHQHLSVNDFEGDGTVVAFLPRQQLVRLGVHHHIFIFYRLLPAQGVHREHPLALTGIVHLQVAAGAPRADGGMASTYRHHLSRLQLGRRDAEDDGSAEQGQPHGLHPLVTTAMDGSQVGIGVEMQRQRTVTPIVRKHIVLGSVEVVDARYHVPLAPQHLLVAILHLVGVDDVRQGMMTAHQGCRLYRPQLPVLGLHQQVLVAHGPVLTVEIDAHMQAFSPCRMIVYVEFQLH